MKERMNMLNEEILAKFLMGECTEDELREVNAWMSRVRMHANCSGWRRFTTWGDWGILRIHKT